MGFGVRGEWFLALPITVLSVLWGQQTRMVLLFFLAIRMLGLSFKGVTVTCHQAGAIVTECLHHNHEQECFDTVLYGAFHIFVRFRMHLVLPLCDAVRPSSQQIHHKRQMASDFACDNPRPSSVTFGLLVAPCTISDTESQPSSSKDVEGCASWHYKHC